MASQKVLAANRYPYPKEEAVLRAHVAGSEEERRLLERRRQESLVVVETAMRDVEAAERVLEAAREALESAQMLHDGIAESCRALDARVDLARMRLHPIRRLPDDVLGEIFQFLVIVLNTNDSRDTLLARKAPFAVSQVCRRWRTAAFAQPRLWRYVNLDMDQVGTALRHHDPNAANDPNHSCKWCRFLQFHLQRSRSVGLYLRLVSRAGLYVRPARHIWAVLANSSPRVRMLDIECGGDLVYGPDLLLETEMPILESATINCTSLAIPPAPDPVQIRFFKQAPRLHRCIMHHCELSWTSETQVFPALTSLEFFGGTSAGHRATTGEIHGLLSRCPGLRQVKIDLAHFDDDAAPQRSYPRITDVSIAVRQHDADEMANSFVFPSAERLDLLLGSQQASRTMIAGCSSTLSSVVIHQRTISPAFALSFSAAVLLKSIELVRCKLTESFFARMATPLIDGTLPCPVLKKLHLSDSNAPTLGAFKGTALLCLVRLRNDKADKDADFTRLSDVSISWSAKANVTLIDGFAEQLQELLK